MQSGSFSCTVSRIIICLRMMDTVVVRSEVSLYKCNPPCSSGISQFCRNRLTSFNKSLTWIPKWIWLLLNSLSVPQNPIFLEKQPPPPPKKKNSHSWGLYWVTSWVAPLLHHLFRHRLQAVRVPWVRAGRAPACVPLSAEIDGGLILGSQFWSLKK